MKAIRSSPLPLQPSRESQQLQAANEAHLRQDRARPDPVTAEWNRHIDPNLLYESAAILLQADRNMRIVSASVTCSAGVTANAADYAAFALYTIDTFTPPATQLVTLASFNTSDVGLVLCRARAFELDVATVEKDHTLFVSVAKGGAGVILDPMTFTVRLEEHNPR